MTEADAYLMGRVSDALMRPAVLAEQIRDRKVREQVMTALANVAEICAAAAVGVVQGDPMATELTGENLRDSGVTEPGGVSDGTQ